MSTEPHPGIVSANPVIIKCSGTFELGGVSMDGNLTPEKVQDMVRTWLMQDGWSLRQESFKGDLWAYVAEDRYGRKISVRHKAEEGDVLVIQASMDFGEVAGRIDQLPEGVRNALIWELRFELLRSDLEFSGVRVPLKEIVVARLLFLDALTKDTFLHRASQVRKGILAIQWILAKKLTSPLEIRQMGFITTK